MTNLELVKVTVGKGNEKVETVLAMSSSHTALREYLKEKYDADTSIPDHWTEPQYVIRHSNVVIVPAKF
jgi:hypothetical protein